MLLASAIIFLTWGKGNELAIEGICYFVGMQVVSQPKPTHHPLAAMIARDLSALTSNSQGAQQIVQDLRSSYPKMSGVSTSLHWQDCQLTVGWEHPLPVAIIQPVSSSSVLRDETQHEGLEAIFADGSVQRLDLASVPDRVLRVLVSVDADPPLALSIAEFANSLAASSALEFSATRTDCGWLIGTANWIGVVGWREYGARTEAILLAVNEQASTSHGDHIWDAALRDGMVIERASSPTGCDAGVRVLRQMHDVARGGS